MNQQKEITVIGHKNPDTDSICSALAYADLKRKLTGQPYVAKRAGEINKETAFALSYFGSEEPEYLSDIRTRVADMEIKQVPSVDAKISIKQAYSLMKEYEASTLCITDEDEHLQGLITMSNIAASDMDVYDNRIVSKAKTPYSNIVKVLEAKVICGDTSGVFDQGRVTIAANTPERMVDYVAESMTWSSPETALNHNFLPLKPVSPASSCALARNPMRRSSSAQKTRAASSSPAPTTPTPSRG